jgi:hypothetical protein
MRPLLLLALLLAAPALRAVDNADEMQPEAANAIRKGLAFLAAAQSADGSWSGETGVTGPCIIAFLAAGQLPGRGEYGPTVARALLFLTRSARPNGLIFTAGADAMYHHGLSTLALAEAWGQSRDPKLRPTLKRAVDLICSCQNQRGGWRYQPVVNDDDMSVTVMQLMALRASKDAGIEVPKEVIDAGLEYVKQCHLSRGKGGDGSFCYAPGFGYASFGLTGAGVTSLQVAGDYKDDRISEGVEYLLKFRPLGKEGYNPAWYSYGIYYATMGIYQAQSIGAWGRKAWAQWYPAVIKDLVGSQAANGAWNHGCGAPFDTAMAVIVLAIPCRYLPIFQR